MALPKEVSGQEFNKALQEQGTMEELNDQEFEEIKAELPSHPPFPLAILMVALVKDFIDLVSFGIVGAIINIAAALILWLWVRKRMGFVKRILYRRYILRMFIEFLPVVNMIPLWTFFVIRGHALENKKVGEILEAADSLLSKYRSLLKYVPALVLIFSLLFFGFDAFAQFQNLKYPDLPGASAPDFANPNLGELARYVFQWLLTSGIAISTALVIYAGLRYLTAFESVERKKDARNQLAAVFLGLLLLFGSYVVLSSLDPNFLAVNKPVLPSNIPMNIPLGNIDIPLPKPQAAQEIKALEQDSYALADFLLSETADWYNVFVILQVNGLVNELRSAGQKTCAETAAYCAPKGLAPVPVDCRWKDGEALNKVVTQAIQSNTLEAIRQKIERLTQSEENKKLTGTVKSIQNCLSDKAAELSIMHQAQSKNYLDFLNVAVRDPLFFYCLGNFSSQIK